MVILDWVSCRDKNLCHQYIYSRYGGGKTGKIPGENYWSMFSTIEDKYLADYYWNIQRPEIEHSSIDLGFAGYWKMDVYRKYYSASLLCRNCAPKWDNPFCCTDTFSANLCKECQERRDIVKCDEKLKQIYLAEI